MKRYSGFALVLTAMGIFIAASMLSAREKPGQKTAPNPAVSYGQIEETQTLWNINNIAGWIRNDGYSGNNPYTGNWGAWYPRGTAGVIFWDGIVWGGRVTQSHWSQPEGSYRVGGQTYFIGTAPGYIVQAGTPTTPPYASNPNQAFIYRIRADWENLTVNDPEVIQDAAELNNVDPSQVTPAMAQAVLDDYEWSWNNWPVEIGAPFYDLNGNGIYEPPLEKPGLQNADQVTWFVFNDLDAWLTTSLYGSQPIGLEVQVTMWGYKSNGAPGQASFHRYRLINKSGFPVDSMFIAAKWSDPDLGVYTNDFVGCDSILNIGFCYNGYATDPDFQAFGLPPAAIGYAILQGPVAPSPGDTAWFDFRKIPDFKNLPMTSFGSNSSGDPIVDPSLGEYSGTLEWYNWLNGYIPWEDTLNPYPYVHGCGPYAGRPTKFPLNGDPVSGAGDIDGCGSNLPPGDRRMTINTGPFTMQNGDTQEVVFAVVGGIDPAGDHLAAVAKLKENVQFLRSQYPHPMPFPVVSHQISHPSNTQTELRVRVDLREFSDVLTSAIQFFPEIGSEPDFNVQLFDDGMHNDSLPNDNIWGNFPTLLNNRKYPFKGELAVGFSSGLQVFQGIFSHVRLRPLPDFTNWRVVWENGQQDSSINNFERVHLRFDIQNADFANGISNATVINFHPVSNNQTIQWNQPIPPGGSANADLLYFILEGPPQGDSLAFSYRVQFDYHSQIIAAQRPVIPWSPPAVWGDTLGVTAVQGVPYNVFPIVADPALITGHLYQITYFLSPDSISTLWRLQDLNTAAILLDNQPIANDPLFPHPVVDGIQFKVTNPIPDFVSFQVVANAAGPLDPPEMGTFAFNNNGFPWLFNSLYPQGIDRPTERQQVGPGIWGINVGGGANDGTYATFLERTLRNDNADRCIPYDYEMRFTAIGGYGWWAFTSSAFVPVPFEMWNIGINTPDDPSDDYRMIPWVFDEADNNDLYDFGTAGGVGLDHGVSGGLNDPYLDWVYWIRPVDYSPGTAGYDAFVAAGSNYDGEGDEVMARMVLVNLNGGDVNDPTFPANVNQLLPEEGTIFRIITSKPNIAGDTLRVLGSVGIAGQPVPETFELSQNYPNPFNPVTHIQFSLAGKVKVKLEVFNVLGQRVKTLLDSDMAPGKHEVAWDGRNDAGARVGSGLYFYRLKAGDYVKSRKMILIK